MNIKTKDEKRKPLLRKMHGPSMTFKGQLVKVYEVMIMSG